MTPRYDSPATPSHQLCIASPRGWPGSLVQLFTSLNSSTQRSSPFFPLDWPGHSALCSLLIAFFSFFVALAQAQAQAQLLWLPTSLHPPPISTEHNSNQTCLDRLLPVETATTHALERYKDLHISSLLILIIQAFQAYTSNIHSLLEHLPKPFVQSPSLHSLNALPS